jgi:hypothetical protein
VGEIAHDAGQDISFQTVMLRGREEGKHDRKCNYYRDVEIENIDDTDTFCENITCIVKSTEVALIVVHPISVARNET